MPYAIDTHFMSFLEYAAGKGINFKRVDAALDDTAKDVKEEIEFDDFEKCDLRVARVLECEEVPKANKLLKFKLKVGNEERIILSGIKKYYKPEDLVGKNVLIIANLKPRKIMGIESRGMILSAVDDNEDLLSVTTTLDGNFKPGTIVC